MAASGVSVGVRWLHGVGKGVLLSVCALLGAQSVAQPVDPGDVCVREMARPTFSHRQPTIKSGDPRSGRLPSPVTAEWRQVHHDVLWPDGMYLRGNVRDWLLAGDFQCLELIHTDFLAADARFPDGQRKLSAFLGGARDFVEFREGLTANEIADVIGRWRAAFPQSQLAEVLNVRMLHAAAWAIRGGGYASTVSPERWEAFRSLNRRALSAAQALSPAARDSFLGQYVRLRVMLESGEPLERVQKVSLQWIRQYPDQFDLAAIVAERLLPAWGGTPQQLDRYILAAGEAAGQKWARRSYADLYTHLIPGDRLRTVLDLKADWISQGLQELAESGSFEHIVRLQNFACSFHDVAALLRSQALWEAYARQPQLRGVGDELDAMCRSWVATLPKA